VVELRVLREEGHEAILSPPKNPLPVALSLVFGYYPPDREEPPLKRRTWSVGAEEVPLY
jgi:hypothetical protein